MKKILLLLCSLFFVSSFYADEKKEIALKEKTASDTKLRPYSLLGNPVANQEGTTISVSTRNASSIDISIVNAITQEEIHQATYGEYEVLINLEDSEEGIYIIYITVNGIEYYGEFILS